MTKSRADLLAGIAFVVIAFIFWIQLDADEGISRIYPLSLTLFIGAGGLYYIAKGLYRRLHTDQMEQKKLNWRRVGTIGLLSIIYGCLVPNLGFFASTGLFLFISFVLLNKGESRRKILLLRAFFFAAILSMAIWAGFVALLHVPTPQGVLF